MAMRVAARFNPQDENAAAIGGKSVAAAPPSIQRQKLGNITNKQLPSATPKPKNALLPSKIDTGRTPLRNISNVEPRPAAISGKTEAWAKQEIERVHFTGDDMEILREKLEHQEMEKRVKAVLSFRTEIFPPWHCRASTIDGPLDSDGKLKLDAYEEESDVTFDEVEEMDVNNLEPIVAGHCYI